LNGAAVVMFFVVSKVLGFVAQPSNVIALLCILGAALWLLQRRRAGIRVLLLGVALLLVFGYSPVSNVLLLSLSERFPKWQSDGHEPDGIIVLGGAIDSEVSAARGAIELDSSAERILAMLQLARQFPHARIVFSGGSGKLIETPVAEAPFAARLLREFDLDGGRVVLDSDSRTTSENAAFVRHLVGSNAGGRWLLVTSAFHMPRSVGVFRAAGFDVEAYPVDWRTRGWVDVAKPFSRLSSGLARSDVAMHEWIGLVIYWLAGRSAVLLPAPPSNAGVQS